MDLNSFKLAAGSVPLPALLSAAFNCLPQEPSRGPNCSNSVGEKRCVLKKELLPNTLETGTNALATSSPVLALSMSPLILVIWLATLAYAVPALAASALAAFTDLGATFLTSSSPPLSMPASIWARAAASADASFNLAP